MKKNSKPTSIRLSSTVLVLIATFQKQHPYWSRSEIINHILESVFMDFEEKAVYDLCRRPMFRENPAAAHFKILDYGFPRKEVKE